MMGNPEDIAKFMNMQQQKVSGGANFNGGHLQGPY
jgi:hypothetical protein